MTIVDIKNLEKLDPQQRKQFEDLLEQHPYLRSKMDTSRDLNTGVKSQPAKSRPPDELDYDDMKPASSDHYEARPSRIENPVRVDAVRHSFDKQEDDEPPSPPPPRQSNARQAEKPKEFSPEGKEHPILTKMKATLGIAHEAGVTVAVGGTQYELFRMNRDRLVSAMRLASHNSLTPEDYQSNLEVAIVASAVRSLDGVPKEIVFGVPEHETDLAGNERHWSAAERVGRATDLLFDFLKEAPSELTNALATHYEQAFPAKQLLDAGATFAYCPEANCLHKRIVGVDEKAYCPYHGVELTREDALPNPSA